MSKVIKRSDMLAIIYDAFYDCLEIPNDSFVIKKDLDEYILSQIEKQHKIYYMPEKTITQVRLLKHYDNYEIQIGEILQVKHATEYEVLTVEAGFIPIEYVEIVEEL